MKRWLEILLSLALAVAAASVLAAPVAIVDAVQMPAWIERAGKQMPATAGMELIATDTVRTGAGANMGTRNHFLSAATGDLLFGMDLEASGQGMGLLAVAAADAAATGPQLVPLGERGGGGRDDDGDGR